MGDSTCGCTRRQAIRSLVGGSLLMPGILAQVLAQDETTLNAKVTSIPTQIQFTQTKSTGTYDFSANNPIGIIQAIEHFAVFYFAMLINHFLLFFVP